MSRAARLLIGAALAGSSGTACGAEPSTESAHPVVGAREPIDATSGPEASANVPTPDGSVADGPIADVGTDAIDVPDVVARIPIYGSTSIVIIPQIHFAPHVTKLSGGDKDTLKEIADLLAVEPLIRRVSVQGHADRTEEPFAKRLSVERAQHAREALIRLGVDPSRLVAVGYGAERPIDLTPHGRTQNARVEFKIVDVGPPY
jgi:outer membrane protein OmpA-like peptidoglycan-associated protein